MKEGSGQHECCELLRGRASWEQLTKSARIAVLVDRSDFGIAAAGILLTLLGFC